MVEINGFGGRKSIPSFFFFPWNTPHRAFFITKYASKWKNRGQNIINQYVKVN
jgi:hypothetical protein